MYLQTYSPLISDHTMQIWLAVIQMCWIQSQSSI